MDAQVNRASAVHVHIGVESIAGLDPNDQAEWVARLLYLAAHYESALFAVTGSRAREGNHYARSIKVRDEHHDVAEKVRQARKVEKNAELRQAAYSYDVTRYHSINITRFFSPRGRTVEFRVFSGSTSGAKIAAWVQLVLGLAEKALVSTRYERWDAEQVSYLDVTSPEDMLKKLLYTLGWVLGRKDVRSQVVEVFGLVMAPDALPGYRREFRRLARRFVRMES